MEGQTHVVAAVEAGSGMRLGRCFNVDAKQAGPDIFNPEDVRTQEKDLIYFEYTQVTSPFVARDLLGVSDRTLLKAKAGLLSPDGAVSCLCAPPPTNTNTPFTEIVARLTFENVVRYVRSQDVRSRVCESRGEVASFTHFVQSVTIGGELAVRVKITNPAKIGPISNSGGPVKGLGFIHLQLLEDIKRASSETSVVSFQCYSTGCEVLQPNNSQELMELLEAFPQTLITSSQARGVPLKFELKPLNAIVGLQDVVPLYRERELVGTRAQLRGLEVELDDLLEAERLLDEYWDEHGSVIEANPQFQQELDKFQEKLNTVKQSHVDFISLVLERCRNEDEFVRSLQNVQQRYKKVRLGDTNAKFTRKVLSIIDTYAPKFNADEYVVLREDEWKEKKDEGYPEHLIKKEDAKRKEAIDKSFQRNVIPKNRVQHMKDNSFSVFHHPDELRIVLVGKTGVGKSATGNLLVGERFFKESPGPESGTEVIKHKMVQFRDRTLRVIDTPGLFDTRCPEEKVLLELAKTLETFPNGVHAFIYVLNSANRRFTDEEQKTLHKIKNHFGKEVMKHTVVVLTHADATFKDTSLSDYVANLPEPNGQTAQTPADRSDTTTGEIEAISMKTFLKEDVNEHVMAINNTCKSEYERRLQREALIELIDVVQTENEAMCFKNKYFDKAERRLKERKKEEDKAKEELLEQEVAESQHAIGRSRAVANHMSDRYLKDLQLRQVRQQMTTQFDGVAEALEGNIRDLNEGIGMLYPEAPPVDQRLLSTVIQAGVIEVGKMFLIDEEEKKIYDIAEEAWKRRKEESEKEEEHVVKVGEAGWNPKERYQLRKEKKEAEKKSLEQKKEETKNVKEYQERATFIRKNLIAAQQKMQQDIKSEKLKFVEALSEKGRSLRQFELALDFATQATSSVAQTHLLGLGPLKVQEEDDRNYVDATKVVEEQLKRFMQDVVENLRRMQMFETAIEGLSVFPVQGIIMEAINRSALTAVGEVADKGTMKEMLTVKTDWQRQSLQKAKEALEKCPRGRKQSIEQYETATNYTRQWALYLAEDLVRKLPRHELERLKNDMNIAEDWDVTEASPETRDLKTEHYVNATGNFKAKKGISSQKDCPILEEAGETTETGAAASGSLDTPLKYLEKYTNELGDKLRFQVKMDKREHDVLEFLGEAAEPGGFRKQVQDALAETVTGQCIENETQVLRKQLLMESRRATKLKTITTEKEFLENNDSEASKEARVYELSKMYTSFVVEFLAQKYLNFIRLQEVRKEDENNFQIGMATVGKQLHEELKKNDPVAFDYFTRFMTPEGRLTPIDKIARNSIQQVGRHVMLELEDNLDNKLRIEMLREDWTVHVEQEKQEHEAYLGDLIDILTATVRDLAPEYAKQKDINEMKEIKANGYKDTVKELTPRVLEKLSDDAKTYFDEEKIGRAITKYVELNEEFLSQLAKDVKCFPAAATVTEKVRGTIRISDVRVGDQLLTSSPDGTLVFQDIYMLGHAEAAVEHTYLELYTNSGHRLLVSREHLLHVERCGNLRAARDVVPGDELLITDGGRLQTARVAKIETMIRQGAYCPHTTGGSVIVDGVLASCFTDVVSLGVANALLLPARLLYGALPAAVFRWMFPYNESLGMPKLLLCIKNAWMG